MHEDFQIIRAQVDIFQAAVMLCGRSEYGTLFKYPNEKTASLRVYPSTQSFYDYGRGVGGDVTALWAHIRGCSKWEALQQIREAFHLPDASSRDRPDIRERIQEQGQRQAFEAEVRRKARQHLIFQVDQKQGTMETVRRLIASEKIPPYSSFRMLLYDREVSLNGELDELCGVDGAERR